MATATVSLADLNVGKVPKICVKTGLPATVSGSFAFGHRTVLSELLYSLYWICAWSVIGLVLVPFLGVVAMLGRHSHGVVRLPMTSAARWMLWLGRLSGWAPLVICTLVIFSSWRNLALVIAAAVTWLAAALWGWVLASYYLRPEGGVPFVGVDGVRRVDPLLGPCVELYGVSERFADAMEAQRRNTALHP